MTNFSTIARLRQMLPEVRIISMCLVDADGYRQAALSGGANDFISKTALTTDLLPAIRQVIQTSSGNADQKHLLS
jgi:DNA-binding NarL/FixJ family response regulator